MPRPATDRIDAASAVARGRATSHDVARAAGVSQSTVSRALRSPDTVSPQLRDRVLAAARSLGYTPSELGRSLVTQSTKTIGMVVTDLGNPFYPFLITPLHDELSRLGYRMLLLTDDDTPDSPQRLLDRSIDGAVLTTTTLDSPLPHELEARGLPFVFLARESDDVAADAAVVDNTLGASILAAEILRLRHRRIGAIFGPQDTSTGRDRRRGVRVTLAAAGLDLDDFPVLEGPFISETGHEAMHTLMSADNPPTVVICGNDSIAIGALNAACGMGLAVPGDVSIVGFDDLPIAGWELVQLTTVRQPMDEMARVAGRTLVARIEGRAEPGRIQRTVFEPELVIRRTLGPPRS
jgi:LacI family transcriptional regulator